jgi:hypothetical protein
MIERAERLDHEDAVRCAQIAKTSSKFGWKYRNLADRCFRYDFDYGTDLNYEHLRQAVYEFVVEGLDYLESQY